MTSLEAHDKNPLYMIERKNSNEIRSLGVELRKKLERILVNGEKRERTFWERLKKVPEITFLLKDLGESMTVNWRGELIIATEEVPQPSKTKSIVLTLRQINVLTDEIKLISSHKISRKGRLFQWVDDLKVYEPLHFGDSELKLKSLTSNINSLFPQE